MLVNATSLGMSGQPPLDIDLDRLPASALVSDIIYIPKETPLLAAARARGNRTVNGLGMLLNQARPGKRRRRPPWPLAVALLVVAAWMVARRARRPEHLHAVPT